VSLLAAVGAGDIRSASCRAMVNGMIGPQWVASAVQPIRNRRSRLSSICARKITPLFRSTVVMIVNFSWPHITVVPASP